MSWRETVCLPTLLLCGMARAQVSGTVETYFGAAPGTKGLTQTLSWGELNARLGSGLKATLSATRVPSRDFLDEACVQWRSDAAITRVGRFRTAFGFSDWSELFYNGFNHIPLVRTYPLVDDLGLTRDDSGVEITAGGPGLQVQAALVDTTLDSYQILPDRLGHGTIRLQHDFGQVLLGLDALHSLTNDEGVYGLDLRWTAPHWNVRAEYMAGAGGSEDSSGYYLDASYRLPGLPRTLAVARTEGFRTDGSTVTLHTVGLRQVFRSSIALNLNFGWGSNPNVGYITTSSVCGWTARAMYQLAF